MVHLLYSTDMSAGPACLSLSVVAHASQRAVEYQILNLNLDIGASHAIYIR